MTDGPESDGDGDPPPIAGASARTGGAGPVRFEAERVGRRRAKTEKRIREWLTFAVLLAYTLVTGWILSVQLEANRISTRNFDAQNRAWVHLAGAAIAFDPGSTPASPVFVLDTTLENVGNAPAFGVGLQLQVVAGSAPLPAQADLCGPFREGNKSRNVLFPHAPFHDQQRRLHVQERVPGAPDMGVAHLIGCIDYSTKPGGAHRQTQVIRTIVGKDRAAPATFPAFLAEGAGLAVENDLPEQAD